MKELLLLWMLAQPVSSYDASEPLESRKARLDTVATAISNIAGNNKTLAAFLAVDAREESGFRLDVSECRCPAWQCDKGKAHGLWQIHKAPSAPSIWATACGTDLWSITVSAQWVTRYYDSRSLECSFAALGGNRVSCGVNWAKYRAKQTRKLAAKL
jgi:hypothetical protein